MKNTMKVILKEANSYLKEGCEKIKTIEDIMEMDINYEQWASLERHIDKMLKHRAWELI